MRIKSFSIVDYKNKEAVSYSFSNKVNLIVSSDNTMGKSSLLKSLYFNLGFKIKQFPSKWNTEDMFFQVEVTFNKKSHIISRQNNIFKIDGNADPLNEREYSDWLQEQLAIEMQLPNVRTKELYSAYSSAVILPFYVDQDDSWDGIMYRRVSDALGQYSNIPQTIFEYLFGLSDIEIQELQNSVNSAIKSLSEINSNINSLERLIEKYHKEVSEVPAIDKDALQQEIAYYLKLLNENNEKTIKFKVKLINDREILDKQKQELAELDKLLRLNSKRYKEIQSICNYCHSNLTDEQSLTRLNLSNNKFEIQYLRDEVSRNILNLERKIENTQMDKENIMNEIDRISTNIKKSKELLTIEEYVNAKAKTIAMKEMNDFIQNELLNKSITDAEIKKLKAEIERLKKEKEILKEKITLSYNSKLNDMKTVLHDIDTKELDFLSFKKIKGSGMDKNKKYLAYYLTYMSLIDSFGVYKLPFCIDSFIKNEITTESAKQMFIAIEKYLFTNENQVFFSLVKQNKQHLNNLDEYKIIDVGNRVLSKDKYEEVISYISS